MRLYNYGDGNGGVNVGRVQKEGKRNVDGGVMTLYLIS